MSELFFSTKLFRFPLQLPKFLYAAQSVAVPAGPQIRPPSPPLNRAYNFFEGHPYFPK